MLIRYHSRPAALEIIEVEDLIIHAGEDLAVSKELRLHHMYSFSSLSSSNFILDY
jgi:hypothetical protein